MGWFDDVVDFVEDTASDVADTASDVVETVVETVTEVVENVEQATTHPVAWFGAVVEAAAGILRNRQAGCFHCGDNFFRSLAAAGGRVTDFVQLVGKTPEIVDGFRPLGKSDRSHGGIPVGADNHNGARQRQRFGHGRQRSTGSTGT